MIENDRKIYAQFTLKRMFMMCLLCLSSSLNIVHDTGCPRMMSIVFQNFSLFPVEISIFLFNFVQFLFKFLLIFILLFFHFPQHFPFFYLFSLPHFSLSVAKNFPVESLGGALCPLFPTACYTTDSETRVG